MNRRNRKSSIGRRRSCAACIAAAFACTVAIGGQIVVDAGRGPVAVHVPSDYDPDQPMPLVLLLHGYTGTGAIQESYFGLLPLAEQERFLYAYPDGTVDSGGAPFWNATDACCDLFGSGIDDSSYLLGLIFLIRTELNVNPWRVHITGHSNGGFMSYRLACDHADVVASIGSLAGATYSEPADCTPKGPVHVLQIHGDADGTVLYPGGLIGTTPYPGAVQTVETWAAYDECNLVPDLSQPSRDLVTSIAGAESTVQQYADGCDPAGSAELWTIPGGGHVPQLAAGFRSGLVDFLLTHPKAGLKFDDKQTLSWPSIGWATAYRVYRGELADLFDTDGDGLPDPGHGSCISDADPDTTDTTLIDSDTPLPGEGSFYVVGFVDAQSNESILGTTASGLPRWPPVSCP